MPGTDWIVGVVGLVAGLALAAGAAWLRRSVRALLEQVAQRTAEIVSAGHAAEARQRAAETAAQQIAAERDAAQARADELAPLLMLDENRKRYRAHWNIADVTERLTSILADAAIDHHVAQTRFENAMLFNEWVRRGGNPHAPWVDIVKWKQAQEKKP